MATQAIRFIQSTPKSSLNHIQLRCNIKPGASKQREGISSISDERIEVCVAAQARDGEANKAVKALFSTVSSHLATTFDAIHSDWMEIKVHMLTSCKGAQDTQI